MEDKLEKKLKTLLPYIIIIGVAFLLLPILFHILGNKVFINNIILMIVFPIITIGCNYHYTYKNSTDYIMMAIAPVLFIPSMFLYGIYSASPVNAIIFLVAYFICGYIGSIAGEIAKGKKTKNNESEEVSHKRRTVPQVVSPKAQKEDEIDDIQLPVEFEDSFEEVDTESANVDDEYSLDAILAELHNRRD